MTSIDEAYEAGLKFYDEGKPLEEVLAHFEELRRQAPTDVRVAVSLGWLHILLGNKQKALLYTREAKHTTQGRFNIVLAYLAFGEKGVREKFEEALGHSDHDGLHDAIHNLDDAISRKGGSFPPAEKMLKWIQEVHHH
jgi:tetratricopeptide (TPR) repeat protein